MRKINTIKQQITTTSARLDALNESVKKEKYVDVSLEKVGLVVPFLLLICLAPTYFLIPEISTDGLLALLRIGLSLVWVGLYIYCFVLAGMAFARDISQSAAKGFFIVWTMLFVSNMTSLWLFIRHWAPDSHMGSAGLIGMDLSKCINPSTFPVFFVNDQINMIVLQYWVAVVVISLIPSFLIFLAMSIRLIKETAKKNSCKRKVKQLAMQITEQETALNTLNEELGKNIEEAAKTYASEIQKDNPSTDIMIQAAEGGCSDAALWVALEFAQALIVEKNDISKAKVASSAKQIQEFTQLANGCGQKDLCTALDVWSYVYTKQNGLVSYASTREKLDELKGMKKRVSPLSSCKNEIVRIFAEEANSELQNGISSAEKNIAKKEAEEAERRRRSSSSSYSGGYSGGYSGSYAADQPLSPSELYNLNNKITGGLWNETAIEHSDLSDSQKQQLKDYNRIYGD